MSREIVIDFHGEAAQSSLTHRVRNFGEALYHAFMKEGIAAISLEEVDRATTQLRVTVKSARKVRRVSSLIEELLDQHHLAAVARVSQQRVP